MSDQRGVPMRANELRTRADQLQPGDNWNGMTVKYVDISKDDEDVTIGYVNGFSHVLWDNAELIVERPEPPLTPQQILEWLARGDTARYLRRHWDRSNWSVLIGGVGEHRGKTASEAVRKAMEAGHE